MHCQEQKSPDAAASPGQFPARRTFHVCVLLVEDDPLIREIMAESLEDAGFEVIRACSGDDAIAVVNGEGVRISALVTDLNLSSDVDGADVADLIRQRWPQMPVVIASGRPDIMKLSWKDENGYRLLSKPYGPRQLIGVLRDLIPSA